MQNKKLKFIFFGTSEFGEIILKKLIEAGYGPSLVVTAPDKPAGRKQIIAQSPVKVAGERYGISVSQPEKVENLEPEIRNLNPDLAVVAAYGQILPQEILEIPKFGCLNIHPSLLPKYRGATPVQSAILNGEKKTGVTIILMDPQIDHGPILAQKETEIGLNESGKQLHDRLAVLGSELLVDTLPNWLRNEIGLLPQEEKKATYAKILTRQDGKINWKKSVEEIARQVRAFDPWPGTFTFWIKNKEKISLKILKARVLKPVIGNKTYPPGKTLVVPQNELGVQCKKGFLVVEKLQLEGKKSMSSEEFLRGHPDFIGVILK